MEPKMELKSAEIRLNVIGPALILTKKGKNWDAVLISAKDA